MRSESMEDHMDTMRQCLVVMVLASVTLAGCASSTPDSSSLAGVDTKRVAKIEAAARRAGVEVYWVNYPRKTEP